MSGVLHVAGIDEIEPHIEAQLAPAPEHPGDDATCSQTIAQRACAVVASRGTSGCVGTSGLTVTSGVTCTSGRSTASMGIEASGGGALEMQVMSAVCCGMQSVKLGVSPEHAIAEARAHDVKSDDCDAHAALLTSAAQPERHALMSLGQPAVAATRAQSEVQAPVMAIGASPVVEASVSKPPPPPPPPRALHAASAIVRMIEEVLEVGVIARSYAVPFARQEPRGRERRPAAQGRDAALHERFTRVVRSVYARWRCARRSRQRPVKRASRRSRKLCTPSRASSEAMSARAASMSPESAASCPCSTAVRALASDACTASGA